MTVCNLSFSFIGLKNQGATCYMNSVLQQLFMIPRFREGVLTASLQIDEPVDIVKPSQSYDKLKVFLEQLQNLFLYLVYGPSRSYDPLELVKSLFNDPPGFFPLDSHILQQNDSGEFFSLLVDRIENILKYSDATVSNSKELVNHCFGGKIIHQLIGSGDTEGADKDTFGTPPKTCPHSSNREEAFNSIQLEVKNKRTIKESLELYVKEETLEGDNAYFCEKCNAKVC
jgi:ubiquitin C-terminal hydrolase